MNNGDMYYQQQISTAQPAPQQTVASGPIAQYPHQLQSNHSYPTAAAAYGGNYYSSLASPHGAGAGSGATAAAVAAAMASGAATVLPLPGVPAGPGAAGGLTGAPGGFPVHDTTGQVAPPGMKPRVTATLWEDEGSLCFQVEARGICVARREDNSMINGTKLLNVAGMTRGRRDGILKSEKTRHVVKIGPMHLKGVWIPFERALDFANKEKITELLYPLFVHNIGALLYHPTNQPRGGSGGILSAERRRAEQLRSAQSSTPTLPSIGSQQQQQSQPQAQQQQHLHHHHHHPSMGMTGPQTPISTHATTRPPLDRAHTFPTPPTPTSATGVIDGGMQSGGYAWPQSAGGSGGISAAVQMDAGAAAAAARSMPATPATTPPSHSIATMPAYGTAGAAGQQPQQSQPQQPYDSARQHMYAHPSATGTQQQQQYSAPPGSQDRAAGSMYGQAATTGPAGPYIKNEMAPPSGRPGEPLDPKQDPNDHSAISHHHHHHQHQQQQQHHHHQQHHQQHQHQQHQHHHHSHHSSEEEHDQHEHDAEYTHNSDPYDSSRAGYNYAAPQVDHHHNPHITSDLTNSPGHASGSGRATPRTAAAPTFYPPTATGYSSPTRAATASAPPSNVYNVINDQGSVAAAAVSSAAPADVYAPSAADLGGSVAAGYESAQQPSSLVNGGTSSGLKRGRVEDEDDEEQAHQQGRPSPNGGMADYGKRRRTLDSTVVTATAPAGYDTLSRPASAIAAPRSRR